MGKWIKCKNCGHEYHNDLKECPQCYRKTPLTLMRFALCAVAVLFVGIVVLGIVLGSLDNAKINSADSEKSNSSSSIVQNADTSNSNSTSSTVSEVYNDETTQSSDTQESSKTQSSSSSGVSSSKPISSQPEFSTVVNGQESDKENTTTEQIQYVEFTLPEQLDTEKVIKSLSSTYFPLTFYSLDYSFRESAYFQNYSRTLDNDHLYLRISGKLPRCVIYQYEFRGYIEDLDGAKKLCEQYFSENAEYFKTQFDVIKRYVDDVQSFEVRFYFNNYNEYVSSNEIK